MPSPPPDQPEQAAKQSIVATEHWDEYWRYGFVTSCGETFEGNYEGGLATAWEAFFAAVPDGATILDIGTGNGAIAMIANRLSIRQGKRFVIHGIDQADIDPGQSVSVDRADLEGILFHPRTPAEQTGFDSDSFDVVCGQYALEYTPLEAAIAEMARLSAPGAKAMFVMHHSDSVVLETAAEELRLGGLIEDSAFFHNAAALLERMQQLENSAEALNSDQVAESHRKLLNQSAAKLVKLASDSPHPTIVQTAMANVSEAFKRQSQTGAEMTEVIRTLQIQVKTNLARLADLCAASVDKDKTRKILEFFESYGFSCEAFEDIYHQPGKLAGRVLRAKYAS